MNNILLTQPNILKRDPVSNQTDVHQKDSKLTENSYGVVLTNREVTTEAERLRPAKMSVEEEPIREVPWTLDSMLSRYNFNRTISWTTAQTSHAILTTIQLPTDIINNSVSSAPFYSFVYWRGDIEIDVQVLGSPFHAGKLMATFLPLRGSGVFSGQNNPVANFASIMVNPTLHLFPNTNSYGKLYIPFNSVVKYLNLLGSSGYYYPQVLGTLVVYVMNPLTASAGSSTSVSVSVFSKFVNSEFKVPSYSTTVLYKSPPPQLDDYVVLSNFSSAAKPQAGESSDQPTVTSVIRTTAKEVVNTFIDSVLPENVIDDAIRTVVPFLDKPLDPNLDASKLIFCDRLNFSSGVDRSDKLAIFPSKMALSTESTFGTNIDEMDFSYLKKKETYLGSFNITTSNVSGNVLASIPMNPVPVNLTANTFNKVPLLSYLTYPWTMWRGGLTFRFEVIATSVQTCKIFVALNYDYFGTVSSIIGGTSQYGKSIEINQGTTAAIVTCPFISETDYKYVPTCYTSASTVTSDSTMGMINVLLINPLVCPSNAPTTITCNVYISGADDYEVSTLSYANNFLPYANPQSDEVVPPFVGNNTSINLSSDMPVGPKVESIKPRTTSVQPCIRSIAEVLKKFQPLPNLYGNVATVNSANKIQYLFPIKSVFATPCAQNDTLGIAGGLPLSPIAPNASDPGYGVPVWSGLFCWYAAMYSQFLGPLRFKLWEDQYPTTSTSTDTPKPLNLSVYYFPPIPYGNPPLGTSPINTRSFLIDYSNPSNNSPGALGVSGIKYYGINAGRAPLAITGGSVSRVLEVEIPFASRFSSVYLDHEIQINAAIGTSISTNTEVYPKSYTDLGSLLLMISTTSAYNSTSGFVPVSMAVAFGDESRFGCLYSVPYIVPRVSTNGTVWSTIVPDAYPLAGSFGISTLTVL